MTRGRLAILLPSIALVIALLAAVALHQSLSTPAVSRAVAQTYFSGYYPSSKLIDVTDVNLDSGEYDITYSFTVVFTAQQPKTQLVCELKDPNGLIIKFVPDSTKVISSSPVPQRVKFSGNYQLPYVAVGLRCHASTTGTLTAHFSNVHLGYSELG
jgi:hypothetical protein